MSGKSVFSWALLVVVSSALLSCRSGKNVVSEDDYFTNPITSSRVNNSYIYLFEGQYYFVQNYNGNFMLQRMSDPSELDLEKMSVCAEPAKDYGLQHLWYPRIVNIDGVWYIYATADDGNTDNHKMYVFMNDNSDPFVGQFRLASRLVTDAGDNWAIHGMVFSYLGELYMVWSGWQSRRAYVETQCLYIARMNDPLTLSGERVLISMPEYDWERQTVSREGFSLRYPVYVDEHPFFFCDEVTDKAYIYYSASAGWTGFCCIGELSADKNADLLDPASWKKSPAPVFVEDRENNIFGPSVPCIFPSPDHMRWYLAYTAAQQSTVQGGNVGRTPCIKPISFSKEGHPEFGSPLKWSEKVLKVTSPAN